MKIKLLRMKNMFLKMTLATLIFSGATFAEVAAQNNNLYLYAADGSEQTFALDNVRNLTLASDALVVNLNSGSPVSVNYGNLRDFSLKNYSTAITEDAEIDADAIYRTVTVAPGITLTVAEGKTLTADKITLKSDANGTATFINNGTANITTANVEQYLSTANNRVWYYLASPVTGASSSLFGTNKVGDYNEKTTAYSDPFTSAPLMAGRGYVVKLDAVEVANLYTFAGTLNNGLVSVPVTRTGTTAEKRGFNLIGNPYPSYLDWDEVAKTDIESTIWTRTHEGGAMVFKTYNADAQVGDDGKTTAHIAPLQAFWVRVSDGTSNATVEFTNAMRLHKGAGDANLRAAQSETRPLLRLQVSNGTSSDYAVILFDDRAANAFDRFDSEKMSNENAAIPEIYTLAGNEQVAINTLTGATDGRELALGFRTGTTGTFSLSASTLNNIENAILIDNTEKVEFDLTKGTAYEFAGAATDNAERFTIAFRAPQTQTGLQNTGEQALSVYAKGNQIVVAGTKDVVPVRIYNAAGRKLYEQTVNSQLSVINCQLLPGVYIVKAGTKIAKITIQ
jgi:hypothetical protein